MAIIKTIHASDGAPIDDKAFRLMLLRNHMKIVTEAITALATNAERERALAQAHESRAPLAKSA